MTGLFLALLSLLGGLGIVLHGLSYCSDGLQRSAGQRMKGLIRRLTKSPLRGVAVGALLAGVVQSSTAVTVMLVGLANAGLVTLTQSIGVILGADAGTTITVQLLAFDTGPWSLAIISIGYLMTAVAKRKSYQYLGQALVGIGLVFFGLKLIGGAITPLKQNPAFGQMITLTAGHAFLAFMAATLFTGIVHSSAATLGLAVSLAAHGVINLDQAIPIILGANIGTCATALLTAAGTSNEAKRVAVAHTFIKVLGVLVLWPLAGPFADLIGLTAVSVPRQIANAHTAFNLAIVLIGLPLAPHLASLVKRLLPESLENRDPGRPIYIDRRALEAPVLALDQASREVGRMGELVQDMLARIPELLKAQSPAPFDHVANLEHSVDRLFTEISGYLADIGARSIGEDAVRTEMQLLHVVSELEHAGDAIFKISLLARKRFDESLSFSDEGVVDMTALHGRVQQLLNEALTAFRTGEADRARLAEEAPAEILAVERQLRETHLGRLRNGLEVSRATSAIHLDVLAGLQRVADHAAGIALIVSGFSLAGVPDDARPGVQLTLPVATDRR